jgi:hypothetical protein
MVLRLRENPPSQWDGAKCHMITVGRDYDPFFSEYDDDIAEAVDFCNGESDGVVCPLRDQCLSFALVNNQKYGVWGGTTPLGRKAIRKRWPSKGGKPNSEWKWLTEEQALEGLPRERLKKELDEELRSLTED